MPDATTPATLPTPDEFQTIEALILQLAAADPAASARLQAFFTALNTARPFLAVVLRILAMLPK